MEQEDYVSFEVARLLEEKGYKCKGKYIPRDITIGVFDRDDEIVEMKKTCFAPTLYEVRKWLIEKYNLFVSVIYNSHDEGHFKYRIYKIGTDDTYSGEYYENKYSNYEEALNEGIKDALKKMI